MKVIAILIFLFTFTICVQGQVTIQRVIPTTLNPPTVCTPGKIYNNATAKKSWLGGSDTSCAPYALGSVGSVTNVTGTSPINVATGTTTPVVSCSTCLVSGGALGTPSSGTLTNATGLPEGGLSLTDITTNNFSITKHGFVPKGTNVGSFLRDDGTWAAPSAGITNSAGVGVMTYTVDVSGNLGPSPLTRVDATHLSTAARLTTTSDFDAGTINIANSGWLTWNGRTIVYSPSDGVVRLNNSAETDFGRVCFGLCTSAFPAWKRSGTTLAARLADDSGDAPISGSGGTLSSATIPLTFSNAAFQSCTSLGTSAGGVLTCTVSSAKVKQGFGFFHNGLNTIRQIQPQTFSYRRNTPYWDGGKTHLGLVAENLKLANPLLTSETGAGMLQPEPLAIAAVQIQALKELDAQLQTLKAQVARQQRTINRLRHRR